jgi:hypothetical protein
MKKKIAIVHIAITLQLVVGHQRTIGTPQRDEVLKLVQTTLLLKVESSRMLNEGVNGNLAQSAPPRL